MRTLRSQTRWMVAIVGGFCLVAAAVTVAQRPTLPVPVSATDAHELSTVFRGVAQKTLPCVVTIETRQKVRQARVEDGADPLERFFEADPRFREFFRQMPRQRQAPERTGMGSGFIVDASGIIVTNNHVVADADEIVVRLHDGREFKGTNVQTDPRTDLAILRIEVGEPLQSLRFGDSDGVFVGDWVVAVGNPFGHELTVTSGIISAKGRGPGIAEREDFLQTDAAINPGNSGGPLLNLQGDVIGVNTAISSRSGGFDGIGFAVPGRMAWWVVQQLIEHDEVRRAFIGITIQPVTNDLAEHLELRVGEGAIVTQIMPDSPGKTAKLEPGDVVLSLDGKPVSGPRSLQGIVERLNVDKTYSIEILRNGKRQKLPIILKEMPNDYTMANVLKPEPAVPEKESDEAVLAVDSYGFKVRNLTPEIAEQLGIEDESGVVVSSVDGDGAASRVLSVGDVILKVSNQPVDNVDDFNQVLAKADPQKGLFLLIKSGNATRFAVIRKAD
ncbi:MAG: Do family serine endopeptidase [Planctomycetota bacterium]|nr:Do family serine endopeptidase [Planctomycetota bacterium]